MSLWGCSHAPLAELSAPATEQTLVPCLKSPLIAHAGTLAKDAPGKNYVRLLEIGNDALLLRIHLIRSARKSIAIQTMIWTNDETGQLIMSELIQAAYRGVKVQLLIDPLASGQNLEIASFLADAHPNFQVKFFNPVTGFLGRREAEPSFIDKLYAVVFSFKSLNQRMHNKTFIVDDLVGITGGRNYQNAYYDKSRGLNYKDRDVLMVGPVVREMKESFDCYWMYERSVSVSALADVKMHQEQSGEKNWQTRESYRLNDLFEDIDIQANEADLISQLFVESLIEVSQAHFIADDPQKRERSLLRINSRSKTTLELAGLVSHAKQSVYIQTPYLVLSSPATALFKNLRKKHPEIDVSISTNSLAATDSWHAYALSYKQKKTYLSDLNFKVYEFKPLPGDLQSFMPGYEHLKAKTINSSEQKERWSELPDDKVYPKGHRTSPTKGKEPYICLHAKSLVVDDSVSFVGSYNLDPRSENINTESGLVVRDKNFSRILKNRIKKDMEPQNSWVVARKKRPFGLNVTNAMLVELSHLIPLVDVWPFRYSASFELINEKPSVEVKHPDFYINYKDVGSFPQLKSDELDKEIGARGTKAFLSFVKPLL
jgi:phosphatidylserine/phosphatidylglycerophosphate/cardiolipin synthase-like enzyme